MHELSKREKKIARVIIDKGVDTEFKAGLEKAKKVIAEWESGSLNNRDGYHKLFKEIKEQDKRIARRYDGLGGSRYLLTVAAIYIDKQITEEDLEGFSEETKAVIHRWAELSKDDE
jgi:hypothetical protein